MLPFFRIVDVFNGQTQHHLDGLNELVETTGSSEALLREQSAWQFFFFSVGGKIISATNGTSQGNMTTELGDVVPVN